MESILDAKPKTRPADDKAATKLEAPEEGIDLKKLTMFTVEAGTAYTGEVTSEGSREEPKVKRKLFTDFDWGEASEPPEKTAWKEALKEQKEARELYFDGFSRKHEARYRESLEGLREAREAWKAAKAARGKGEGPQVNQD